MISGENREANSSACSVLGSSSKSWRSSRQNRMETVRTKNLKLRRTTMVKMDGKRRKDLRDARDSCKAMIDHCKTHMAAIDKEFAEDRKRLV
jgi:hypothetical protein